MQSLSDLCYRQLTYSTGRAERKGSADSISEPDRFKGTASAAATHEKLRCRSTYELAKVSLQRVETVSCFSNVAT